MGGVEFTEAKRFFKVMMPGFNEKLNLPQKLYNKLKKEKSERAVLKSCLGTCEIKVCRNQELGSISFGDGWSDFVQRHGLCIGDFVVFEHIGNFHFNAFVFDASACEKDFFLIDPKEEPQEVSQRQKDYFQFVPKEEPQEVSQSEKGYFQFDPKEEHKTARKRGEHGESSGISMLFESKNPFFNLRMKRRHGKKYVPSKFWRLHGFRSKANIVLRDPGGRVWPVNLCFEKNTQDRCRMGRGWHSFCTWNKLKVGDVCRFELITNSSNNVAVMDVHIFPAIS